jgi:hypothetical protein
MHTNLKCLVALTWSCGALLGGVPIDRIAVVVGDRVIKDSDIAREMRLTDFLNGDPLNVSPEARKKASDRLIDQALIRREIEVGAYQVASPEEVDAALKDTLQPRFKTQADLESGLKRYGVTEAQVRKHLQWQLTVLRFIEQRFRPGVLVSDEELKRYYDQHRSKFGKTFEEARHSVEEELIGEKINQQFYTWLEEGRRQANIQYRELELR